MFDFSSLLFILLCTSPHLSIIVVMSDNDGVNTNKKILLFLLNKNIKHVRKVSKVSSGAAMFQA